jgi:hypothetical protein
LFFTFSTRNGLEDHGCPQLPLVSAASRLGISRAPVNTGISPNKSPSGLPSRAIEPDLSGEIGWAMRLFRGLPQARCDQPPSHPQVHFGAQKSTRYESKRSSKHILSLQTVATLVSQRVQNQANANLEQKFHTFCMLALLPLCQNEYGL